MIRKTLIILSLIGLLLSLGLWGVSYLNLFYLGTQNNLNTWDGYIVYDYRSTLGPIPLAETGWSLGAFDPRTIDGNKARRESQETFLGQTMLWPRFMFSKPIIMVAVPLWMPTFLFASLGFAFLYLPSLRRRKRKKLGLCLKCGYDLRGSEDRCPECGEGATVRHQGVEGGEDV